MSRNVVVVDDSLLILRQLGNFLEREAGLRVVAKGQDGDEAVSLYRKHQPDLLTLDVSMPSKSGPEAIREILAEFPDANILVVSAMKGSRIMECLDLGAKGFVEKPLTLWDPGFVSDIKETIAEALES